MIRQRTLKSVVRATGVGLALGREGRDRAATGAPRTPESFSPAPTSPGSAQTRAQRDAVVDTRLSTCIGVGAARISTIEHLMSRFRRTRNRQRLRRRRRPRDADHGRQRRALRVPDPVGRHRGAEGGQALRSHRLRPVEVRDGDKWARLEPVSRISHRLHASSIATRCSTRASRACRVDFAQTSYIAK